MRGRCRGGARCGEDEKVREGEGSPTASPCLLAHTAGLLDQPLRMVLEVGALAHVLGLGFSLGSCCTNQLSIVCHKL